MILPYIQSLSFILLESMYIKILQHYVVEEIPVMVMVKPFFFSRIKANIIITYDA